jgi:hypothetical protein
MNCQAVNPLNCSCSVNREHLYVTLVLFLANKVLSHVFRQIFNELKVDTIGDSEIRLGQQHTVSLTTASAKLRLLSSRHNAPTDGAPDRRRVRPMKKVTLSQCSLRPTGEILAGLTSENRANDK